MTLGKMSSTSCWIPRSVSAGADVRPCSTLSCAQASLVHQLRLLNSAFYHDASIRPDDGSGCSTCSRAEARTNEAADRWLDDTTTTTIHTTGDMRNSGIFMVLRPSPVVTGGYLTATHDRSFDQSISLARPAQ